MSNTIENSQNYNSEAIYNKGLAYYKDQSSADNLKKAFGCFLKAAEMKHAEAQSNLGLMYEFGSGVPCDAERAVFWYRESADQGSDTGMVNLAKMLFRGEGARKDKKQARKLLEQACDKNNVEAAYVLYDLYEISYVGNAENVDLTAAEKWILFIIVISIIPSEIYTFPIASSILADMGIISVPIIILAALSLVPTFLIWFILSTLFLDVNSSLRWNIFNSEVD